MAERSNSLDIGTLEASQRMPALYSFLVQRGKVRGALLEMLRVRYFREAFVVAVRQAVEEGLLNKSGALEDLLNRFNIIESLPIGVIGNGHLSWSRVFSDRIPLAVLRQMQSIDPEKLSLLTYQFPWELVEAIGFEVIADARMTTGKMTVIQLHFGHPKGYTKAGIIEAAFLDEAMTSGRIRYLADCDYSVIRRWLQGPREEIPEKNPPAASPPPPGTIPRIPWPPKKI